MRMAIRKLCNVLQMLHIAMQLQWCQVQQRQWIRRAVALAACKPCALQLLQDLARLQQIRLVRMCKLR